jgi:AraC-like DNA-binding protein
MDAVRKKVRVAGFLERWYTRPPYCCLNSEQMEWLADRAVPLVHAAGSFPMAQDQPFASIELIVHGNVELVSRDAIGVEIVLQGLGPGDIYGFTTVLCDGGSIFGVRAVNRLLVFALTVVDFFSLTSRNAAFKDYFYREAMARMRQAYLIVNGRMDAAVCPSAECSALPAKLKESVSFIRAHYADPLTLEDAAAACAMSKFYYSRLFKSALGCSFKEYLNRVRIEAAKDLLRQDKLNISEACYAVGFNDLSYFSRVFKRLEKQSPSDYRHSLKRSR